MTDKYAFSMDKCACSGMSSKIKLFSQAQRESLLRRPAVVSKSGHGSRLHLADHQPGAGTIMKTDSRTISL